MIPIHINGLFPSGSDENSSTGSVVVILASSLTPSNDNYIILQGHANQDGVFQGEIPTEIVGQKVTIRIRRYGFEPFEQDLTVEEYGLFFATRLEKDYVVQGVPNIEKWNAWDTDEEYLKALNQLLEKINSNPLIAVRQSTLSPKELKEKLEEELGSKIKSHVFEEFFSDLKEVELSSFNVSSLFGKLLAANIQAEYITIRYYEFIFLENFTRLISLIDQHVLYDLPNQFFKFSSFDTFHQIELNANFINYLESFAGLRTCTIEFHKSFTDEIFSSEYAEMVSQLPASNGILLAIRNKYHHARGFHLTRLVTSPAGQNKYIRRYVIPLNELCDKLGDKLSNRGRSWLEEIASEGFIDVKELVLDHYYAYTYFLNRYSSTLSALVRRKTGCEIRLIV